MQGTAAFEALDDLFLADLKVGGDVGDGGPTPERLGESAVGLRDGQVQVVQASWESDYPAAVAEVSFDLADDGGNGVGDEVDASAGVEAVHCLDETDRGGLLQILERVGTVGVA